MLDRLDPDCWPRLHAVLGTDLRSLALFRVLLGCTLLGLALAQLGDIGTLYGDVGVAPRHAILETGAAWTVSLHFINGSLLATLLFALAQALAALCLTFGRGTRVATAFSLVLWVSWMSRYPLLPGQGDAILALLLLWSLWLPLGARYSVDAALSTRAPPEDPRHLSVASVGLLLNVALIFIATALRMSPEWRSTATALAAWHPSAAMPDTLAALATLSTWNLLLFGTPLLLLSPLAGRWGRHSRTLLLGLATFLLLAAAALPGPAGPGYCACLAALAAFIPADVWAALAQRPRARRAVTLYYDEHCAFCLKSVQLLQVFLALQHATLVPAQSRARTATLMEKHQSWVVIDDNDQAHLKWAAMVALLRASPLFPGLDRLLALPLWNRPGDALYDAVARHRGRLGTLTAILWPRQPVQFVPATTAQRFATLFLLLTLGWQSASLVGATGAQSLLRPLLAPLHLDSRWGTPLEQLPTHNDWLVVTGETADGHVQNLLAADEVIDYRRPSATQAGASFRWRHYWQQLTLPANARHREGYAALLCRQANGPHLNDRLPGANALLRVQIDHVVAPRDGGGAERTTLWQRSCFGNGVPTGHHRD